jgi:hypothetical protein
MSWLSELFGGGGEGPGERMWAQHDADMARAAQEKARTDELLAQYQALNPPPSPEEQELARRQAQQQLDEFDTNAARAAAVAKVGSTFAPDFERQYAPDTLSSPFVQSEYEAQRGKAEDYLTNLRKRGLVTDQGYAAGEKAIEGQGSRVRTQLGDIANTILGQERGGLTDIANRAKGAASTISLGQDFDPTAYGTEAQNYAQNFNFGDLFKAQVPSAGLFDVSEIPKAAGAAQGAQNLAFDPAAVAGTNVGIGSTTDEAETTPKKPRSVSVF